jgi:hypothetical protein
VVFPHSKYTVVVDLPVFTTPFSVAELAVTLDGAPVLTAGPADTWATGLGWPSPGSAAHAARTASATTGRNFIRPPGNWSSVDADRPAGRRS